MKKISVRLFFAVMWKGICQAWGWFLGLFGKREGKFAKCLRGVICVSVAVIMIKWAVSAISGLYDWYDKKWGSCDDTYCYANQYVYGDISFHHHGDGRGTIVNLHTGQTLLKHVAWVAKPEGNDSLVCFSNGRKRGYFSKYTGRVVIEPKYGHAWIFSDGLASVEENGFIKFIDATGKVIIDKQISYVPSMEGYVFHNGYCLMPTNDGCTVGLMDKTGRMVLPQEYSSIYYEEDEGLWEAHKGLTTAVYDKDMNLVLMLPEGDVYISDGTIDVTMPEDHTIRKYDLNGRLINDFYITDVRSLEYEKDEILYHCVTHDADGDEYAVPYVNDYRPKEVAPLRAYSAGHGYEGLMTADGHVVTMPLYKDIEALGHDLYLCTSTNYDKVIVNDKGEIVR